MDDSLQDKLPKALRIKEKIREDIMRRHYGNTGDEFISVRKLAKKTGVSLVTAHRITNMLKTDGLIKLVGNKSYLSYKADNNKTSVSSATKTPDTIGMIVTNLENPFFAALSKKVEEVVRESGLKYVTAGNNYDFLREKEIIDMFCAFGVSGIISCPGTAPDTYKLYSSLSIPVVFIGRKLERLENDTVLVNHHQAVRKIVEHFIGLGYTNFAYAGFGELENDQRRAAYISQLREFGYDVPKENVVKAEIKNFDSALPALRILLKKAAKPIAVFCFHDLLAVRVVKACNELKLKIPAEVAVSGFDNLPISSEIIPSLTSIAYPLEEMAGIAFDRLIRRIRGETRKSVINYIEPELVARESTMSNHSSHDNKREMVNKECLLYQTE